MAKQRDAIRMSEAEADAFLEEAQSLQVATIGKDGAPHLTTVWFALKDGDILFETYGKSQKVMNLRRDARIAVLAEAGTTYETLRGVSINGRARIVEENPERTELMGFLLKHHFPDVPDDQLGPMTERMAQKRVVIVVSPEKVMSWDHRKLEGKGP